MDYLVKTTAVKSIEDVMKAFPEMAAAIATGVHFAEEPVPSIDIGKLRGAAAAEFCVKKPGRKM